MFNCFGWMLAVLKQREWIDLCDHLVGHLAGRMQAHTASNIPRYNIKASKNRPTTFYQPTQSNERRKAAGQIDFIYQAWL